MSDLPLPEPTKPTALDIQHDLEPENDHGIAKHIPHIGHAALFFTLLFFMVVFCIIAVLLVAHVSVEAARDRQGLALFGQALGFMVTLIVSFFVFPLFWQRTFSRGIEWNALAAGRYWTRIIPAGIALSFCAQVALHFLPTPEKSPLDQLFKSTHEAWLFAAFAVILAPLTEEIAFRGFLLPAFATAYDWLALERTPAGIQRWETSAMHSPFALVFATIFSSIPFALMHAGQLSHAWGALGVLYVVSLALSFVRIRLHSVACSALLHATYNATIFAVLLWETGGFRHLEKLQH